VEVLVDKLRTVEGLAHPLITWPNYFCYNSPLKKLMAGKDRVWHSSSSCISEGSSTTMTLSEPFATPTSQYLETPVQCQLPSSQAASPVPEEDKIGEFADAVQRNKAKAYRVGDLVEVRSGKHDTWIRDAEIVDTVEEGSSKDGSPRRAGSVKVLYNNGERFQWIPPKNVQTDLRPSLRLKAPDTMLGGLEMLDANSWIPVHVEICKGYVQWWKTEAAASQKAKSVGHSFLLGMQCWREDFRSFKFRVENHPDGAIFSFRAGEDEDVGQWVHALWEHARHCMDLLQFQTLQIVDSDVVNESQVKSVV